MRRPIAVLAPVLVVLFIAGSPFFRLQQGVPDASIFPAGIASRDAWVSLMSDFRPGETSPITILVDTVSDPTDAATIQTVIDYAATVDAIEGIDRVEGPFSLTDPATGAALSADQMAQLYAAPAGSLPPELEAGLAALRSAYIRDGLVRLDAISPLEPAIPAGTAVVPKVRAIDAPDGVSAIAVGGVAAISEDFLVSQNSSMPWAIGTDAAGVRGHPVPAVRIAGDPAEGSRMTLLSVARVSGPWSGSSRKATFTSSSPSPRSATPSPATRSSCSAVLIGLSMDYEVLLLSRIQESYRRTGDNTASVAEGLAKTAGVITGAAIIMVVVFSAFALAEVVTIKSIGVGMAIAVVDRRDDRPGPAGAGHDAPPGRVELVGARDPRTARGSSGLQPRRGRGHRRCTRRGRGDVSHLMAPGGRGS